MIAQIDSDKHDAVVVPASRRRGLLLHSVCKQLESRPHLRTLGCG